MKIKPYILVILFLYALQYCFAQEKLHVVLAGLSHDHVNRMLDKNKAGEIFIIGIAEANHALSVEKKIKWQLPDSLFFNDIKNALKKLRPDLVMVFDAPSTHLTVAEICMPLHIPVMFEKPLCFSYATAKRMEALSRKFNTKIYTNFPSIWYSSFNALLSKANDVGTIGKMVMRGGHKGPIEIGCSKDFTNWLTDSVKNGGGALIDFGCYGALIMTELMNGKAPLSVYASTKHVKPAMYPRVDDAATIVLEYPNATGIIEASWNWPFTIMDAEVFGSTSYLHASEFNQSAQKPLLQLKNQNESKEEVLSASPYKDEVEYLTSVIKNGAPDDNKQLSLQYNLIVVKILDAAVRSAKEARKILLQ